MQQRTPFKLSCALFFFFFKNSQRQGKSPSSDETVSGYTHMAFFFCFCFSEELKKITC